VNAAGRKRLEQRLVGRPRVDAFAPGPRAVRVVAGQGGVSTPVARLDAVGRAEAEYVELVPNLAPRRRRCDDAASATGRVCTAVSRSERSLGLPEGVAPPPPSPPGWRAGEARAAKGWIRAGLRPLDQIDLIESPVQLLEGLLPRSAGL
jgi:hypothetical protein